jgi:hypothetical protein
MAAITGIALKSKLESMMAQYIDKKNTYLKIGKGVSKINQRLKALYNYWVITDQCALTDAEINCIVKDVGVICNAKIVIPVPDRKEVIEIEPRYTKLSTYFDDCTWAFGNPKLLTTSTLAITAKVTGGSGGYTYLWTLLPPQCGQAGYDEYTTWIGSGQSIVLSNSTSETANVSNIGYKVGFKLRCIVTDSGGNSTQILKHFVDQKEACGFDDNGFCS